MIYQKKNQRLILGIPIMSLTDSSLINLITHSITLKKKLFLATVSTESIMKAQEDRYFRDILLNASVNLPDGAGVVFACKLIYKEIMCRLTGIDSVYQICDLSSQMNWKVYFLGTTDEVLSKAIERLKKLYPYMDIVGSHNGYFDHDKNDQIILDINRRLPEILFVAMGMPKQEKWIYENIENLCPSVFIGIGGSLDVISGRLRRAPIWMQRFNMEWLFRLLQEPSRIKRHWVLPLFIFRVLAEKFTLNPVAKR